MRLAPTASSNLSAAPAVVLLKSQLTREEMSAVKWAASRGGFLVESRFRNISLHDFFRLGVLDLVREVIAREVEDGRGVPPAIAESVRKAKP